MDGISANMLVVFGENEIKTVDDLGDLANDELIEMVPNAGLTMEQADNIIMAARAHWFEDDQSTASSSSESSVDEE